MPRESRRLRGYQAEQIKPIGKSVVRARKPKPAKQIRVQDEPELPPRRKIVKRRKKNKNRKHKTADGRSIVRSYVVKEYTRKPRKK